MPVGLTNKALLPVKLESLVLEQRLGPGQEGQEEEEHLLAGSSASGSSVMLADYWPLVGWGYMQGGYGHDGLYVLR